METKAKSEALRSAVVEAGLICVNLPFFAPGVDFSACREASESLDGAWCPPPYFCRFMEEQAARSAAQNTVCLRKASDVRITLPPTETETNEAPVSVRLLQTEFLFFDTQIGILSLQFSPCDLSAEEFARANSRLRCSFSLPLTVDDEPTALPVLAEKAIREAFRALGSEPSALSFFDGSTQPEDLRAEMFSAALLRQNAGENTFVGNALCHLLSQGYDMRNAEAECAALTDADFYFPHADRRLSFSSRGTADVAVLSDDQCEDDRFYLQNRFLPNAQQNYFHLFALVIHQKYALRHLLSDIQEDRLYDTNHRLQPLLLNYCRKYRCFAVSREPFHQTFYTKLSEAHLIPALYDDLENKLDLVSRHDQYLSACEESGFQHRVSVFGLFVGMISVIGSLFAIWESSLPLCVKGLATAAEAVFAAAAVFVLFNKKHTGGKR